MNEKTKKVIVRVLALGLVLLLVFGICIQFVSATENDEPTPVNESPEKETTTITIVINDFPENFPHTLFKCVVANVYTKETWLVNIIPSEGNSAEIELMPGYYFVYNNYYSWQMEDSTKYTINGNKPYNFFFGEEFDSSRYPEQQFDIIENTVNIPFGTDGADSCKKTIPAHENVIWNKEDYIYPFNDYIYSYEEFEEQLMSAPILTNGEKDPFAAPETQDQEQNQPNDNPTTGTTQSDVPIEDTNKETENTNKGNGVQVETDQKSGLIDAVDDPIDDAQKEEPQEHQKRSVLEIMWSIIKKSLGLIGFAVIIIIGLFVIKVKRKRDLEKQLTRDMYDDTRVD